MSLDDLLTLGFLVLLQAVLGLDNLLYISLESKRAPVEAQRRVRRIGIALAVILRIVLLGALIKLVEYVKDPLFHIELHAIEGHFNLYSLIVLAGGVFIVYTALKEIWHMLNYHADHLGGGQKPRSVRSVVMWIVIMNVVFSFDSILSAMALTKNFWVMAIAIVIGGLLMVVLADKVSTFLAKNRMYEVLGLFILFIVGIMLLSEGGHVAGLSFFGNAVTPMSKTTFYFVIAVLVVTDLVQTRYQRRLVAAQDAQH